MRSNGRVRVRERGQNRRQNSGEISGYVIVPDAEDAIALVGQKCIASQVLFAIGMLRAIDFDDQSLRLADEVGDKRPDGLLLAEFETAEAVITQRAPTRRQISLAKASLNPETLPG